MNLRTATLAALAVIGSLPATASATETKGPLVFETESRVEVDASGKVVSIQTTPELPQAALATVEGELRRLRFAPANVDGRPVGGVTYVQMDACAAPDNGVYRLAVKYRGNGPSLEKPYVPAYPREAERAGVQSTWKVTYEIGTDGKASVIDAERSKGGGTRYDRDFRGVVGAWVGALHFRPELVDGHPVSTRVSHTVAFVLGDPMTLSDARKAARERAVGSEACQLAMSERDDAPRAVALDSPFKPLPAN